VLDAHRSVIAALAPGVAWPDMHTLAYRKILGGLAAGGLLQVRLGAGCDRGLVVDKGFLLF
jgi:Xaa-Pro aminopeptidase